MLSLPSCKESHFKLTDYLRKSREEVWQARLNLIRAQKGVNTAIHELQIHSELTNVAPEHRLLVAQDRDIKRQALVKAQTKHCDCALDLKRKLGKIGDIEVALYKAKGDVLKAEKEAEEKVECALEKKMQMNRLKRKASAVKNALSMY